MFSTTRTGFLSSYYPLWIFGQLMGVSAVILVGTLYHKGVLSTDGYNWKTSPFSFHPLMMIIGLLFCYGNAILSYRTVTRVPKMTVKLIHGSLLVLSLVFALVGFIAVIRAKNESVPPNSHFMSLHAWMGLITLILFVLQWIFGFISFLIPKLSLEARQQYLPIHRLWGKFIFLSAVATILMGLSEIGVFDAFFEDKDAKRSSRLRIIFSGLLCTGFSFIVIYLLGKPEFQRPAEEDNEH